MQDMGFLGGSDGKESARIAGYPGSILGLGRFPGGEGMATHSSILTWRIPWAEEPGGLQSMGLQGVGHSGLLIYLEVFALATPGNLLERCL